MMSPVDPNDSTIQSLALYYASWCPYCVRVLKTMKELGLSEQPILRNTDDDQHYDDLWEARGRGTVPVLRIQRDDDVEDVWMPESKDIQAFLLERFG